MDKTLFVKCKNMKLKTIFENAECPVFEDPSQKVIDWLSSIGLNQDLIEEFSSCSHYGPIRINKIYFNRFNEFIEYNFDEKSKRCIENGYLIIGSGLNGDPIVLSLESGNVGYISHDALWEEEDCDFNEMLALTELNVFEFYKNAYSDEFPVDCYECEEKSI